MKTCQYIKKSGNICNKKTTRNSSRCEAHKGKKNKVKRHAGKKKPSKAGGVRITKSSIKFYDVATGRNVTVPRSACKVQRSSGRGGDRVFTHYKGRKLFTFVPKGFEL